MNKFLFKSADADFQKLIQSIETLQKNILYITYRVDTLITGMKVLTTDKGLQKQVDEYFEDDETTSPQTESDEQAQE